MCVTLPFFGLVNYLDSSRKDDPVDGNLPTGRRKRIIYTGKTGTGSSHSLCLQTSLYGTRSLFPKNKGRPFKNTVVKPIFDSERRMSLSSSYLSETVGPLVLSSVLFSFVLIFSYLLYKDFYPIYFCLSSTRVRKLERQFLGPRSGNPLVFRT